MEKHIDLQTFEDDNLRARRQGSISGAKGAREFDRDRYELARVGKDQVLKVCDGSMDRVAWLTFAAPLRLGKHDWPVLWVDVHLGESARVS